MDTKSTRPKLLVILGPTATGKTDLALSLAKKFDGELVACDSRQVYVGLDISSGKLPGGNWKIEDRRWKKGKGLWEIGGVKIWMYDVINPQKQYTVADYVKDAIIVIEDLISRGKLPIIVGGTGLYLKALLEGLSNLAIPIDRKLRKKLERLSLSQLQKRLQRLSHKKWQQLNPSDRQNPRRLIRAIELKISPRRSPFDFAQGHLRGGSAVYNVLKIGLTAPREILYREVDERVVKRINQGMIDEARTLYKQSLISRKLEIKQSLISRKLEIKQSLRANALKKGVSLKRMKQLGLEYGVLADYLSGKITAENEFIRVVQGKIHGLVRRQLTWFKKEKDVLWFDTEDKNFPANVEKVVDRWYHHPK